MEYPVPNEVKQLVLGSLLGDGHIRRKEYNGKLCNSHLIITHCSKQKDYLEWKHSLLGEYKGSFKETNRGQYKAESKSHPHLNPFYELVGKPKRITRKLLNLLDPLGLAIWYMDDGCLQIEYNKRHDGSYHIKRRRITISTDCFSEEEQKIVQRYFQVVWGIEAAIHKIGGNYRLSINYENAKKFVEIVKPHIHPSMHYKIDFNRLRNCHNAFHSNE